MAQPRMGRISFLALTALLGATIVTTGLSSSSSLAGPGPLVDISSTSSAQVINVELLNFAPSKAGSILCTIQPVVSSGVPSERILELPNTSRRWDRPARIPWTTDPGVQKVTCRAGNTTASDTFTFKPTYGAQDVLFPNSTKTILTEINDVGQVTGYYLDTAGGQHGFVHNGVDGSDFFNTGSPSNELKFGAGYRQADVQSLSRWSGVGVVGQQSDGRPGVWNLTGLQTLSLPPGYTVGTAFQSSLGNIVGVAGDGQAQPYQAVEWKAPSYDVTSLKLSTEALESFAWDVNSDGYIAGDQTFPNNVEHPTVWTDPSTPIELPTFGGTKGTAKAINTRWDVTGTAAGPGNTVFYGFLASDKQLWANPMKIPGLGGDSTVGNSVNDHRIIVGSSLITGNAGGHAFVWGNNRTFDLNKVLSGPFVGTLQVGQSVNRWGQVSAWGNLNSVVQGFILSPVGAVAGVRVTDQGFSPANITICRGGVVHWNNDGPGQHEIVDTSGMASFDSGPLQQLGGYYHRFYGAGIYPYLDMNNPSATGTVSVPMEAVPRQAPVGSTFQIYWGSGSLPAGFRYHVQAKAPGQKTWRNVYIGSSSIERDLLAATVGTFKFRDRLESFSPGIRATSDWSDELAVSVRK